MMLEINGIHYQPATAENPILENINLKTTCGKPVIIAGPSGTGKTSLVEIISGLASPQKGEILFNKKSLSSQQRRWLCGVVFQFPERYFLGLTISQELKLGHRRLSGESQQKILNQVGLRHLDLHTAPERLSGGQQRRLAFAIQLLRKPSILLLDEPTAGLDWSVKDEILQLIVNLSREQLLIVVTHEPELFKSYSSSNFLLESGKLKKLVTFIK